MHIRQPFLENPLAVSLLSGATTLFLGHAGDEVLDAEVFDHRLESVVLVDFDVLDLDL